jgi:hypothetical protein
MNRHHSIGNQNQQSHDYTKSIKQSLAPFLNTEKNGGVRKEHFYPDDNNEGQFSTKKALNLQQEYEVTLQLNDV